MHKFSVNTIISLTENTTYNCMPILCTESMKLLEQLEACAESRMALFLMRKTESMDIVAAQFV